MARLLCYSLRVLQSCEDHESLEQAEAGSRGQNGSRGEESSREDDSDRESDGDEDISRSSDGGIDSNVEADAESAIDVFRDARKLYPWQGRQKELLGRFRESIEEDWNAKS